MTRTSSKNVTKQYFQWLEPQIRDEYGNPGKSYEELLTIMFEREFLVFTPRDENRLVDGLDLRVYFSREFYQTPDVLDNKLGPCSFLEVLIGLSRRMAFVGGGEAPGWAWHLLGNLDLHRMSDPLTSPKRRRIDEILARVIYRTYMPDGTGGFFPLLNAEDDMTQIELWYQMNAYINALHPEY